jgi:ribosome-associated protein
MMKSGSGGPLPQPLKEEIGLVPTKATAPKGKTTRKAPARKSASAKPSSSKLSGTAKLRDLIEKSLDADKAEDIVSYDLVGRSSLTDYMIIASGKSARQVAAMAEHLREKLEALGKRPSIEGLPGGDWVLVDTGDVVVHLFRPEVREFYQLESLWAPEALSASQR